MTQEERKETVSRLRFTLQRNNRLRLEFLALLSKLFRDHKIQIEDDLLASLVLATPEELPDWEGGEGDVDVNKLQTLTPKFSPPQPSATKPTPRFSPPQPSAVRPTATKFSPPQPSATRPGSKSSEAKKGKKPGRKK